MLKRPEHLPDFDNPPVAETVLSVQFDPIAELQTAHLGLLWDRFRETFPNTAERPPLDPVFEEFPEELAGGSALQVRTVEEISPRLWFINPAGSELIQVQNGRFIKNWREVGGDPYPHYEKFRPNFDRDYQVFLEFLAENQLGPLRVNQCEVSYVNHIVAGDGWETFRDVSKIFTFWQSSAERPGPPEDLRLHSRFVIRSNDGEAVGRLHVDLQPAFRKPDNRPMYVLNMTARGQVGDGLDFFDIGREWVVASFKQLTTSSMHEVWRIKQS